ncbi:MAG: flagellin [Verrucomicrobia bacterium]|nr:flagellin [Verrucomicrobiota bacterium]
MVINTNIESLQTSNNLRASSARLGKSLSRLSSGLKIVAPSDDAAGLAVSSRLASQIARVDAAVSNVINAVSFTQTQDGFLKTIGNALRRMSELAMLAQDGTKSDTDRSLYQAEFRQLQDYISVTKSKTFNEQDLFSNDSLSVTVDAFGHTFALTGINLDATSYANAYVPVNSNISTSLAAASAVTIVQDAINKISVDRSTLGALQQRLNFTSEQLVVTKENLSAANSRIADTDVAVEATEYARGQILVQSGTAMLTQANSLPQAALRLISG